MDIDKEFTEAFKEEIEEASKLPPHLAKFFDKDGNLKKDAADRVAKGREKINWKDVTPKGYGPKEEIEKEARTYKDRTDDDEKKKKKHFAFGGKKKSRHGESGYGKGEEVDRKFAEAFGLDERKMTDAEMAEREEIVKKMKPKLQSFKDRYGDDAKKVMYATATKQAMEEVEIEEKKSATGYELYHIFKLLFGGWF